MKFKVGDKVRRMENRRDNWWCKICSENGLHSDSIFTVVEDCGSLILKEMTARPDSEKFELVTKGKAVKVAPETHERFMAYGTGCDNKSNLFRTEKELKEKLNIYAHNSSWSGDIIGYKLVPLYIAEKTVKLTPIKLVKKLVTKKKKKK